MSTSRKKVPIFASEDAEREFWSTHDSTDYVDWSAARPVVLATIKPTLRTISIRLPEPMLAELRRLANKRDIPYQSLIKSFLAERIEKELAAARSRRADWKSDVTARSADDARDGRSVPSR